MGYTNPLLALPSAKLLLARPLQKRLLLSVLFRQVRTEANDLAEDAWARRQHHVAAFWRATSTYARHVAILLSQENPLDAKASKLSAPRPAPASVAYRYPLLNLAGTRAILASPLEDRQILALLFQDLRHASLMEAKNSWQKRKAPMGAYWTDCAKHALRLARLLNRPDPLASAVPAISHCMAKPGILELSALLATIANAPLDTERHTPEIVL